MCLARNPRLVYGRMTGWGQDGPLAPTAGHDIDYIAVSGALGAMAREGEKPLPPLNLVGDFGGGGMVMAFGMMCGVFEAQRSGRGQVIDAAMVDGASLMMAMFWGMRDIGAWSDRAGTNVLDSGAHFYNVYETSDGRSSRRRCDRAAVLRRDDPMVSGFPTTNWRRRTTRRSGRA